MIGYNEAISMNTTNPKKTTNNLSDQRILLSNLRYRIPNINANISTILTGNANMRKSVNSKLIVVWRPSGIPSI